MANHTDPHTLPHHAKKTFEGRSFSAWEWEQTLFDGSTAMFEGVSRPDYAFVVGVGDDGKIMLVEDEQPHRPPVLTPPGGKVEKGEDPATAAIREMEEETGYTADTIDVWFIYQPNIRIYMACHGFVARKISFKHEAKPEAGERIAIKWYTFDEFIELGSNDMLRDWMLRIKLLEAQVDPAKKEEIRRLLYENI